jgi:hypothetical protein
MTTPLLVPRGPSGLTEETALRTEAPSDLRMGTVTTVTARGVTVNVAGGLVPASHLDSYSPAVGDTVALQRFQDAWVVLGRVVGTSTPTDNATPGPGMGATMLDGAYTSGAATLASSSGAEVPVPGYSLTFHHPINHSVLIVMGFTWQATISTDWLWMLLRESQSSSLINSRAEPVVSNSFGRYTSWHGIAGPPLGGLPRTYYMTIQRLSGTGTLTVTKSDTARGFMLAIDAGDASLVSAI